MEPRIGTGLLENLDRTGTSVRDGSMEWRHAAGRLAFG